MRHLPSSWLQDPGAQAVEEELDLGGWLHGFRSMPDDRELADGLTPRGLVAYHQRDPTPDGAVYFSRVVYGTAGLGGRELHLYLYARADPAERQPGVVFIHGGGWKEHTPFFHIRACNHLARLGYVTATIHYRLSGEALWPAAIEDAKCAVRWMRSNADAIGLDPDRIAVAGNSAGGHLAALVALTVGSFEGTGGNHDASTAVQAVVLVSPMVDLQHGSMSEHSAREIRSYFAGGSDAVELANPRTHVGKQCPPVLIVTGGKDEITPLPMIASFHDELVSAGVRAQLTVYPDAGHCFEIYPSGWNDQLTEMEGFFEATFAR